MMDYKYEKDLMPIVNGDVPLPNFKKIPSDLLLRNIASGGHMMEPRWGYALINGHKQWAQYFLFGAGMGSPPYVYGGNGYVLAYPDNFGEFAICKHQKEEGAGANHNRGWHPGRCKHCGMDMTVDSSD